MAVLAYRGNDGWRRISVWIMLQCEYQLESSEKDKFAFVLQIVIHYVIDLSHSQPHCSGKDKFIFVLTHAMPCAVKLISYGEQSVPFIVMRWLLSFLSCGLRTIDSFLWCSQSSWCLCGLWTIDSFKLPSLQTKQLDQYLSCCQVNPNDSWKCDLVTTNSLLISNDSLCLSWFQTIFCASHDCFTTKLFHHRYRHRYHRWCHHRMPQQTTCITTDTTTDTTTCIRIDGTR